MQDTHMHKAVTGRVEAKQLLSRRRQSKYSFHWVLFNCRLHVLLVHMLSYYYLAISKQSGRYMVRTTSSQLSYGMRKDI